MKKYLNKPWTYLQFKINCFPLLISSWNPLPIVWTCVDVLDSVDLDFGICKSKLHELVTVCELKWLDDSSFWRALQLLQHLVPLNNFCLVSWATFCIFFAANLCDQSIFQCELIPILRGQLWQKNCWCYWKLKLLSLFFTSIPFNRHLGNYCNVWGQRLNEWK